MCELTTPLWIAGLLACAGALSVCGCASPVYLVSIAFALDLVSGREALFADGWFDARPPLSEKVLLEWTFVLLCFDARGVSACVST